MKQVWNMLSFLLMPFKTMASLQGLWSQGHAGFFGLAKEVTWGTAVGATDYAEILSENLNTTIDRFGTRNVFNGFYEPDDYAGARRSAGSIVMAAFPGMLGHFLKGVFNNVSATTVLSGFLWRDYFTITRSEFADGVPRQPYTLELYRDVGSSHQYAGACLNKLTLALAPNQDLRCTAEFIAKTRALIPKTTPTYPSSPSDPFTFDTASIAIAGVTMTRFEAFTLVVDNGLEGILALNASNEIARIRAGNLQSIRLSGTLDFNDAQDQQDFVNQTERSLTLNLTRGQSFSMLIDIPRFVYTAHAANMAGRQRNVATFEGMARYQVTSGTSIGIQLTTTKSNY